MPLILYGAPFVLGMTCGVGNASGPSGSQLDGNIVGVKRHTANGWPVQKLQNKTAKVTSVSNMLHLLSFLRSRSPCCKI
eukprot:1155323-Pelagomonas_calceolata.AAC.6